MKKNRIPNSGVKWVHRDGQSKLQHECPKAALINWIKQYQYAL